MRIDRRGGVRRILALCSKENPRNRSTREGETATPQGAEISSPQSKKCPRRKSLKTSKKKKDRQKGAGGSENRRKKREERKKSSAHFEKSTRQILPSGPSQCQNKRSEIGGILGLRGQDGPRALDSSDASLKASNQLKFA